MKKILAIGGSNSKNSINKTLASFVARQLKNVEVSIADLSGYDIPLYGIDRENERGIPEDIKRLNETLKSANGVVLSLAEHNGAYSAAFKSVYDWLSRLDKNVWKEIPMFLMATSPGKRGGATVLEIAKAGLPRLGANIVVDFSLPSFHSNFTGEGISDAELSAELKQKIVLFQNSL